MPSKEHSELIWEAANWIGNRASGRGMKGNSEIRLSDGYVADYVCQLTLQYRFYEQYCRYAGLQVLTLNREDGTWIGVENDLICVFEAKATRSDFLSTFNDSPKHLNRHNPYGSMHWCVIKKDVAEPRELPDFWGLLVERGSGLSEIRKPKLMIITRASLYEAAHSILWAIDKKRHYHPCKKCGKSSQDLYCHRCYVDVRQVETADS